MMRQTVKRFFALLLCLVMLGTLLPAFAAQAEDIELIPVLDEPEEEPIDEDEIVVLTEEELEAVPREEDEINGETPMITKQPSSVTIAEGSTLRLSVTATNADSYQWYYRANSSDTWKKSTLSSGTKATLVNYNVSFSKNGYQYRCKVSNAFGYVYSKTATVTVESSGETTYRALLIGQTYRTVPSVSDLWGDTSVNQMENALGNVIGAEGSSIHITSKIDVSCSGFQSAINTAFAGADSNDVSVFYYNGHGCSSYNDPVVGALVTVEPDGSEGYILLSELADMLDVVPGKVVVLLDSCYSGAAIHENGSFYYVPNDSGAQQFCENVVHVFAEKDVEKSNMGDFCSSKYYVLAACSAYEASWASPSLGGGAFTFGLCSGLQSSLPADTNEDGKASVHELYLWIDNVIRWAVNKGYIGSYQTTQEYPQNSSFNVFARLDRPIITSQPQDVTATEGTTAKFSVEAFGATSYQWYYRKSPSSSWYESSSSSATSATLSIGATEARNGFQFCCVVQNANGGVCTDIVTLTVKSGGKPAITSQPEDVTASAGAYATFTVKATRATSYQWYYRTSESGSWNKSSAGSATTASLSVLATEARNGYQYRCKVTNSSGSVYSQPATLRLREKLAITTQPTDKSVKEGNTAKFSVKATGATSYQWYYRKSSSGSWYKSTSDSATSDTLSIKATEARNGFQFRCKVTGASSSVYSQAVTLTVLLLPKISMQPTSMTVLEGKYAAFAVKATRTDSYQWYYRTSEDGNWIKSTASSATSSTMSVKATSARNGYQYRCALKNANGTVYSQTVTLTVELGSKPQIITQPSDQTVPEGSIAEFEVETINATSYQWYFRTSPSGNWIKSTASSATCSIMTVKASSTRDGYQYRCAVSNEYGTVYSSAATLTVGNDDLPIILSQPEDAEGEEGFLVDFTVVAINVDEYQWYYRSSPTGSWHASTAGSATIETMSVKATAARNGYQYRCKLTNSFGFVYSDVATLTVILDNSRSNHSGAYAPLFETIG